MAELDAKTQFAVAFWLNQYEQASRSLLDGTVGAAVRLLLVFRDWYSPRAVAKVVEQSREVSRVGTLAAEGLGSQYAAQMVSVLRDETPHVRPIKVSPVRNGTDLTAVFTRPIEVYQRQIALGKDEATATSMALARQRALIDSNMTLTANEAQIKQFDAQGITKYRRVLHPEQAASGTSCGLCIAASTRIYKTSELMPMHGNCHCKTVPIENGADYGDLLNKDVLSQIYYDSGGTSGPQLKRTRYTVNEHGEYGLVLSKRGEKFRGPDQLGKDDPIGRAIKELEHLRPTLKVLQDKAKAGEDVSGPLKYQVDRIETLTRIVNAA